MEARVEVKRRYEELLQHGKAMLKELWELVDMLNTSRPGPGRFKREEDMSDAEKKALELSVTLNLLASNLYEKLFVIGNLRGDIERVLEELRKV
jgi:hypothetical protein